MTIATLEALYTPSEKLCLIESKSKHVWPVVYPVKPWKMYHSKLSILWTFISQLEVFAINSSVVDDGLRLPLTSPAEIQTESTSVWSLLLETLSWIKNYLTRCFLWSTFQPYLWTKQWTILQIFCDNPRLFPRNGCGPTDVYFLSRSYWYLQFTSSSETYLQSLSLQMIGVCLVAAVVLWVD